MATELPTDSADLAYYERFTGRDDYSTGEQDTIELLLEEALEAIVAYTGGGWESASGSTVPVKNLQCRITRRAFENPDNLQSEVIDGVTYSRAAEVVRAVTLTDSDKANLQNLGVRKGSRTWGSVPISRGIRGQVW